MKNSRKTLWIAGAAGIAIIMAVLLLLKLGNSITNVIHAEKGEGLESGSDNVELPEIPFK